MPGFGLNVGQNVGGGGIPYLTNLVPAPNGFIPDDLILQITVGVLGSLIDLSNTRITVGAALAFDGSIPDFTPNFTGSTYQYSPSDNGYSFSILLPIDDLTGSPQIEVDTQTTDGTVSSQIYHVLSSIVYPPMPFGVVIAEIPFDRFTGQVDSGILTKNSKLFMSASLLEANSGNQFDMDFLESRSMASDAYVTPLPIDGVNRPFMMGPPPASPPSPVPVWPPQYSSSYMPVLNDPSFALMNTKAQIRGTLINTTTMVETVILL